MRNVLTFCLLAMFVCGAVAADKPIPTAEAASKFKVPPGFEVTLFAGEPEIVQPIAFTFDDRGRMWVVECLSYPKWSADGTGSDRVIILEDTNGDGKHDKKTVVLDNGVNLSGIEVGHGGIYLCSTPNFIFIPIGKDDKPSGPPQILLDGWNLKEAKHNAFNGLTWGHDGWLYGTNGIQTKSNIGKPGTPMNQRVFFDCGVWRYHPMKHLFEVYAVGMTNPWGVDWDRLGEMFVTNCVIDHLWHIVPGGRYQRMYGQDWDKYSYGHMNSAVDYKHWGGGNWTESRADKKTGELRKDHDDAGGGHAHCGVAIYNGTQFPAEYRNTLFTCNIHGSRLNNDGLVRTESGMKGVRRPDFAFANDPWFRGVVVKQGPEGSLYVADWTDTGECHNYDVADKTNGRIFRISYGKPAPFRGDVNKFTAKELLDAVTSEDSWRMTRALRVLHERAVAKDVDVLNLMETLRADIAITKDEAVRVRKFWVYQIIAEFKPDVALSLLNDPSEAVRVNALRSLGDVSLTEQEQRKLLKSADLEESVFVRNAYATLMQRLPDTLQIMLAQKLFRKLPTKTTHETEHIMWLAIHQAMVTKPKSTLDLIEVTQNEYLLSRIVQMQLNMPRTYVSAQLDELTPYLEGTISASRKDALISGMVAALQGRRDATAPAGWSALLTKLATNNPNPQLVEELAVLLGDAEMIQRLLLRTKNEQVSLKVRQDALQLLLRYTHRVPELGALLQDSLQTPGLRTLALSRWNTQAGVKPAQVVVSIYPKLTTEEKQVAIDTLVTRPEFAAALLDAIAANKIPKADVTAFHARQISSLNKPELKSKLSDVWGVIRLASVSRVAQTKKFKEQLNTQTLAQADVANGRKLFAVNCGTCHKMFGEGGAVGPELTGAQRTNLDYILENVLDPSAVVAKEYKLITFQLLDGRTLSGIIVKEQEKSLTIRTLTDEVIVSLSDIDSRKNTNDSIMPEGLLDKMTDNEVRDLVAYLGTREQVPLPASMMPR